MLDDVLADPEAVRAAALSLEFPALPFATNFPGRNSRTPLRIDGLDEAVSRVAGERVVEAPRTVHGHARLTLEADNGAGRCRVHVDPQGTWSGILYLTPDPLCRGGTEFYRHRRTGSDRAPVTREELPRYGLTRFEDIDRFILEPEGTDPGAWEHLMTVPMRFNRLVLLRPWLWHTAGPGFGARPEEGRLVLLFFWTAEPSPRPQVVPFPPG